MIFFLAALCVLALSALVSLVALKYPRISSLTGAVGATAGSLIGMLPVLRVLSGGEKIFFRAAWNLPLASFYLGIDRFSAFFLFLVLLLSALSAVYGYSYLLAYRQRKLLGVPWCFYNLLVASMMLVVSARNAVLFLAAWEAMSLSSFFLVTFEHEKENVRQAGWTYLVATHLGTFFLIVLFLLLGRASGSLDFEHLSAQANGMPFLPSLAFIFAVLGFGAKAGFMPFHIWLPEAHPAAPSHVSAVMSGVMIKMGIYGLMRIVPFLGPVKPWWGLALAGIGLLSGILGILSASNQKELKTLLAYSSVENIGIVAAALGIGYLALSLGCPTAALFSFGGALLHVANHALFKGMLFLSAGSVLHGAKTGVLDRLGGLFKKMPWTGTFFLGGAWAASGLPPLNGFVSEFLIYLGAIRLLLAGKEGGGLLALAIIGGLALIGALACGSFAKAFGIIFLGHSRTPEPDRARESGWGMRFPLLMLGSFCLLVGFSSPFLLPLLGGILRETADFSESAVQSFTKDGGKTLAVVLFSSSAVFGLVWVLSLFRAGLLFKRPVERAVTWDCGYAFPTARMQYTGFSFLNYWSDVFETMLLFRRRLNAPEGYFPQKGSFTARPAPDFFHARLFTPLFGAIRWMAHRLRWLQHGRTHLYVLYIVAALLGLLIWNLR